MSGQIFLGDIYLLLPISSVINIVFLPCVGYQGNKTGYHSSGAGSSGGYRDDHDESGGGGRTEGGYSSIDRRRRRADDEDETTVLDDNHDATSVNSLDRGRRVVGMGVLFLIWGNGGSILD